MTLLVDSDFVIDGLKGIVQANFTLDGLARNGLAVSTITLGEVLD